MSSAPTTRKSVSTIRNDLDTAGVIGAAAESVKDADVPDSAIAALEAAGL